MTSMKRMKTTRNLPSADDLERKAVHYLARFSTTEDGLRKVLLNYIRRAAMNMSRQSDLSGSAGHELGPTNADQQVIEAVIKRYRLRGVLNDEAYCETKISKGRSVGRSRRALEQKLTQKGVARKIIDKALLSENSEDNEVTAACILLRRRKRGPYRQKPCSEDDQKKDLAFLARAGFSFITAQKALRTPP